MAPKKLSRRADIGEKLKVSFEFFPPKSENMELSLWETVERLAPLEPEFVSVTYGAGGSTRERTGRTVERVINETRLKAAAHLTCVDATRDEVDDVVRQFRAMGIRHFVALRGDPSNGIGGRYEPTPGGYANAIDLVKGLKAIDSDFEITVSAYPEKHPESPDFATDIDFLKRKIDQGATKAITQCFFDNHFYEDYIEKVRKAGISIPILPGILPIHNFWQVKNFCTRNGTHIPEWLAQRFDGLENDPKTHALVSAAVAAEQVLELVEQGVEDFHFYTLNRAELVYAMCHLIGIRADKRYNENHTD
ncbi:methylenetetrahydrofolate reductase [NAD(P)H] [Bartonella tamiae]|uniref:Methylenetetrahydrofolate reductase n=1 Tax=Bartonella tamiae Th239 TaxID=1094558 RepID=J0R0N5_9HYPH|nr:methylenetetrahydrofolate reductase [NAD(P)H] [Bartonella tamiae]EJF89079.1 5,10-methylenetetrahydrofolate reductase [Bartonella tamiae Th239]EJF94671.1 5,10-methylenetetrahydrofolate reductase [Bartonella tamiae Th307]